MPHFRSRHASDLFNNISAFSPLVGVFGHRQVGKTKFISSRVERYFTLDDETTSTDIEASPRRFLEKASGTHLTAIDECQYAPKLFPALKEWVRTHPRPGQFVLTGSVRFSSRKAIRESLTGRLVSLELYPFVISELLTQPLPDCLPRMIKAPQFDDNVRSVLAPASTKKSNAFRKYLTHGGLPGLCFARDERQRREGISALLNLILDRDLRLVCDTILPVETLMRFLRELAKRAGLPIRYAELKRATGLNEASQKKLLTGLESIFLIRRIPLDGARGHLVLLEDQFEEQFLSDGSLPHETQVIGALYRNLRAQLGYCPGLVYRNFSYRPRSGAHVPLVFAVADRALGFIVIEGTKPSISERRSSDSFLRKFPNAKVVFVTETPTVPLIIDSRALVASLTALI